MSVWTILYVILGAVFLLCGLIFLGAKGRAAKMVSGFNTLPREEQEKYDKDALARDMARMYLVCAAICGAGILLCRFVWAPLGWFALLGLLVWFFAHVRLDARKAFGKYRLDG